LQNTPKVKPPTPPNQLATKGEGAATSVKEEPPVSPKGSHKGVVEVSDIAASSSKRNQGVVAREESRSEEGEEEEEDGGAARR
jgi:hypothetical protein